MAKISVALLCGGQSPEHAISLMSAKNVLVALKANHENFTVKIIYISQLGRWYYAENMEDIDCPEKLHPLVCVLGARNQGFAFQENQQQLLAIDIAFPVLHGSFGEEGSVQGLLKLMNMPYVGSGILGSAINLNKAITKTLLSSANIAIADYLILNKFDHQALNFNVISEKLGLPFFVKPNNTGSSIGVSKVNNKTDFQSALDYAGQYDRHIIVEQFIPGREIECAVLGNDKPVASVCGEIKVNHQTHEFYDYQAKYFDPAGAIVQVPADLSAQETQQFQQMAIRAFKALHCAGLARVDFFYTPNKKIILNEINTLPGFTDISMYPKCWQSSGLSNADLIQQLITFGFETQE